MRRFTPTVLNLASWRLRFVAVAALLFLGAPVNAFGQNADVPSSSSYYVTTKDGTRLAVDVYLPTDRTPGDRHPTLLQLTRYGRSREDPATGKPLPSTGRLDRFFLEHGYVLVKVDARGSGASFGTRPVEYGPQEAADGYDVVQWVVRQPWSDGNVGAYGTSYSGTTAEFLTTVNHPAVKAVIPGWSDFDVYASPIRPYGLLASGFMRTWGRLVGAMDDNDIGTMGYSIRRVDVDTDGVLLGAALGEHAANPDVFETVVTAEFRDDAMAAGIDYDQISPQSLQDDIERSNVPMLVPVSWLDAGTVDGALLRFRHFNNPQKLVIMASTHGGGALASPYSVSDKPLPPNPSVQAQFELRLAFFDHYLKGEDKGVEDWPPIRYFNLGEETYHETDTWPPSDTRTRSFYLDEGFALTARRPTTATGADVYRVDPTVTTGTNNRWMAQMGEPILRLDDRGAMDAKMLTYTTPPLDEDLQIAGWPVVTLQLSSDRRDGMVLFYLEDVDADGRSRYITEGGLRLIHRKVSPNPFFDEPGPYHSFNRADAQDMRPGEVTEVSVRLSPIAALVRRGHRLRLAIAGADADTFDPVPADGSATLTVQRNRSHASMLELTVMPGGAGQER